ncbi:MAG: right-handed parallel beta-helix repeat-containing protein, partial [Thermoplasmatota archaeon]
MKKRVALLVAVMIAVPVASLAAHQASSPTAAASSGSTLYVGGDGPGNYTTIQAAVYDASHGDTVYVYEGLYQEHVTVNASITITGESTDVVVDAQGNGSAFILMASTVALGSLHLHRGGGRAADALVSTRFARASISDCVFSQARQGVVINDTAHAVIDNCSFSRVAKGISLVSSTAARVSNCTFYKNGIGIYARGSTDMEIRGVFSEQGGAGVMLRDVQNVRVERSTLSSNNENQVNLYAEYSNSIHVEDTHIHDSGFAVHFENCVDATITGCHIHDNKIAVRFSESIDGVLSHSDVYANDVAVYVVT